MIRLLSCILCVALASCASLNNASQYQLQNGYYQFRQPGQKYAKVYIKVAADSVQIFPKGSTTPAAITTGANELFLKQSFDVDVLVIPFKYRPVAAGVPRQLNTDFNGNVYFGYRVDHFKITTDHTPAGAETKLRHRAFTAGILGGIGSASIKGATTQNKITDDYNGFTLTRGIAFMIGINNLTVGTAVGWDFLTDRDKSVWIYQNKPWVGLTLSLNLN